jgi:hypothetical protein
MYVFAIQVALTYAYLAAGAGDVFLSVEAHINVLLNVCVKRDWYIDVT